METEETQRAAFQLQLDAWYAAWSHKIPTAVLSPPAEHDLIRRLKLIGWMHKGEGLFIREAVEMARLSATEGSCP